MLGCQIGHRSFPRRSRHGTHSDMGRPRDAARRNTFIRGLAVMYTGLLETTNQFHCVEKC